MKGAVTQEELLEGRLPRARSPAVGTSVLTMLAMLLRFLSSLLRYFVVPHWCVWYSRRSSTAALQKAPFSVVF